MSGAPNRPTEPARHSLPETLAALAFAKSWATRRGRITPEEIESLAGAGFSRHEIEGILAALGTARRPS